MEERESIPGHVRGVSRLSEVVNELNLPEGFHEKSRIIEVMLTDLKVDRSYQRDPSMRIADDIAANWDEVASELILVSDRGPRPEEGEIEGGLFVVNGQHRTIAARKRGMERIWARVIDMSDLPDPAAVEAGFRLKTNVRLGDRPLERFKAQLRAGHEQSIAIVKLLARYGTHINTTPSQEEGINSVTGIETLYALDGGGLLAETLEVIKEARGSVHGRNSSIYFIKGVAWFVLQHSDETDRSRLVSRVATYSPDQVQQRARAHMSVMGGNQWQNYYRALVDFYNEKLPVKSRLEWRLRGSTRWEITDQQRGTGKSYSH